MLPHLRHWVRLIGWRRVAVSLVAQKIFRINGYVSWPVHWSSTLIYPERIQVPLDTFPGLSPYCYIQAVNGIQFGRNVWVGPSVNIISANHDVCNYHQHLPSTPIVIGDNCWLGAGCTILPGVELGNHVVVAAGAIVTQSFPENCLVAGVPAEIKKTLPPYHGKVNPDLPIIRMSWMPQIQTHESGNISPGNKLSD